MMFLVTGSSAAGKTYALNELRERQPELAIHDFDEIGVPPNAGHWTIEGRASVLNEAGGRIVFRFHARYVHLVLRSRAGTAVPFRVLVDGEAPGAAHGLDVEEEGRGTLVQPRLYQLVREPGSITDRTFESAFLDAGVEAYVFTFG
jgi:hypothetical protein